MISSDTRGVTAQVGAVLLLGLFVLMLTIYQANVVPQENRATEFDHSQEVLDEMQTLQTDYHNTMSTGEDIESVVTLGTEYPSRLLAISPPPASGSLTTTTVGSISSDEIDINAVCGQDGTTRALQYEPNYRAYQSAPTITFESSVLYSDFGDEYIVESDQSIVSGDQLTLMPLNGSVSKRGTGRQSVMFRAGKADTATVSGELNLTIPTEIPADQWETDSMLLADEMVSEGGHVEAVVENATADGVDIRLESGTSYDVACRASGTNSVPSSGPAEGSMGGGGGSVTANPGAGKSGTSTFSGPGDSQTLSSAGGLWTEISGVNGAHLENPRFAATKPSDGQAARQKRYFRLGISIANDTVRYDFLITESKSGVSYQQDSTSKSWQNRDIIVYKTEPGSQPTKELDTKLALPALEHWLDGGRLEILDRRTYVDTAVDSELEGVRTLLNNSDDAELFITNMHGRTDAQLVQDNSTDAVLLYEADQSSETVAVRPDGSSHYSALKFELGVHSNVKIDEITNVSMNITDGPTAQTVDNSPNSQRSSEYDDQVYFDGNNREGFIDSSFATGSKTEFNQTAGIQSGGGVTFYVNGFINGAGGEVDLSPGDEVEMTLEYVAEGDTQQQTLSLEIDNRENNN